MRRMVWLSALLCSAACVVDNSPVETDRSVSALSGAECSERYLPWGSADAALGLLAKGDERVARGPASIAVAANGWTYVLDQVNRRVVATRGDRTEIPVTELPEHVEDLAVGADGTIAVYSPLTSTALMFDADGSALGEVAVPRTLRSVVGIAVGTSRRLIVNTAHQETYVVGSPNAVTSLPTLLSSKREGAFITSDGRGLQTLVTGPGMVELRAVRNQSGERSVVSASYPLPSPATAAQIIGVGNGFACVRSEVIDGELTQVAVSRRVTCLDTTNGTVLLDKALPDPGYYLPRHELAAGPTTIAHLRPETDGMRLTVCEVL